MKQHLVVILPALNEERTIESVITSIPKTMPGISRMSVIVVNDGSIDKTAEISRNAGALVISHAQPMGVGAAFHTGIKEALQLGADLIVNIDADGQFNPEDIPHLLAPIQQGKAEFVTASRFAKQEYMPQMPAIKIWGNRWMVRIINFITSKNFTDVSCGFRAYSREAALRLTLFGKFTYTQATIIFRAARDYKPFYFVGLPGIIILTCGVAAGIFVVAHYLATGQTYPYRS